MNTFHMHSQKKYTPKDFMHTLFVQLQKCTSKIHEGIPLAAAMAGSDERDLEFGLLAPAAKARKGNAMKGKERKGKHSKVG